jgi:hypothetical protein
MFLGSRAQLMSTWCSAYLSMYAYKCCTKQAVYSAVNTIETSYGSSSRQSSEVCLIVAESGMK